MLIGFILGLENVQDLQGLVHELGEAVKGDVGAPCFHQLLGFGDEHFRVVAEVFLVYALPV